MSGSPIRGGDPYARRVSNSYSHDFPRRSSNNNSRNHYTSNDGPYMNGSPTRNYSQENGSPTRNYPGSPRRSYPQVNGSPTRNYSQTNGSPSRSHSQTNGSPTQNGSAFQKRDSPSTDKPGPLRRFSNFIVSSLEKFFFMLGKNIGTYPIVYIVLCLIFGGLCGLGIVFAFKETTETNKLWSAQDSEVIQNLENVEAWFPSTTRFAVVLVKAPNVLTPSMIQKMYTFYKTSATMTTDSGITLNDVCEKAGPHCLVNSILELWKYNETVITGLSQDDILQTINTVTISPLFSNPYDVTTVLSEISKNSSGYITGATATKINWLLQGNDTIKPRSEEWESRFLKLSGETTAFSLNYFATRSFGDEAGASISGDVVLLSAGYFVLIIYVSFVLGRLNHVEQGIYLSLSGILCVGLSICVSFGLASAFGLEYGPLHSVLPFLLLGIGVDDMFVIMGAMNNLNPEEAELDLPEKMGFVLKHAGLSVSVTSLTDIVAFGIGATTVLPALKSFCGFAALGILGLFIFQVLFFTATLALDQRRRGQDRNACCCCYIHKDYTPNNCSQRELLPLFFKKYFAPFLMKLPVKIVLFLITLGLFGVNIYGVISLKQEFDSNWFLPQDSYAAFYTTESEKAFPSDGTTGSIYCGNINYFNSKSKFDQLYVSVSNLDFRANTTLDSWFKSYTDFLNTTTNPAYTSQLDSNKYPVNESAFVNLLSLYVTTQQRTYKRLMQFADTSGTDLIASQIQFTLNNLPGTREEISAMDELRKVISDAGFANDECFAYARPFLNWETNKVIQSELYRNLGLAFACVFVVTLILIANLWTCLMVSSCIIFTLVNVGGSMHFWGLTIETVTSIQLILAIGLAVDYSAHIGHTFMTIKGTRDERAKETLSEMGPPVFNGGFSTFLAFILLAGSNSYVFSTFFKVFFLVVWYGLFHGLVYLPIILSWVGPSPYMSADHIYHSKVPPSGDHVVHHDHKIGPSVAMTSQSKHAYSNNGYLKTPEPDYEIDTIYIPPPDYSPPVQKRGMPRISS